MWSIVETRSAVLKKWFCGCRYFSSAAAAIDFSSIRLKFPEQSTSFMYAYGSGVIPQKGQTSSMARNMIDLVIVVDDAYLWHQENLRLNKRHYSMCRWLGPNLIAKYQEKYGANVFCNTMVPIDKLIVKYNVITTKQLITDLLDWETLYLSGRLHKPVVEIVPPETTELESALKINRKSAMHAALLLLPETFSLSELYRTIAQLSYAGDFRMYIGEDRNKILNIVEPNFEKFGEIYLPLIEEFDYVELKQPGGTEVIQDCSRQAVYHHLELLPKRVQWNIRTIRNRDGKSRDLEEALFYAEIQK